MKQQVAWVGHVFLVDQKVVFQRVHMQIDEFCNSLIGVTQVAPTYSKTIETFSRQY